jgi:hypothetical protein
VPSAAFLVPKERRLSASPAALLTERVGHAAASGTWRSRMGTAAAAAVPVVVGLAAFGVYLATLVPGITWRNGGDDGAELAAAAYVWGVAHPPGYPLYLTLVRLAEFLPFGEPARDAALCSAAAAAVAVALLAWLVPALADLGDGRGDHAPAPGRPVPEAWAGGGARLRWDQEAIGRAPALGARPGPVRTVVDSLRLLARAAHLDWPLGLGAAFGGAAFALAPLLWSQAVITEVYTLGAALFGLFLWACMRWLERPTIGRACTVTGSLALLASHQPTFAATLLPLAWLGWQQWRQRRATAAALLGPLLLLGLGPLLLLTLWLRAAADPPLNWGDPSSPARWLAHVLARDYRPYFLAWGLRAEAPRAPYALSLLVRQVGWPAVVLAGFGAVWLWWEHRALALLLGWTVAGFTSFAVLYNARDGEVYLLPAVEALALAAGVGAAWMLRALRGRPRAALGLVLAASIGWQLVSGWPLVDVSRDTQAREWGEALLRALPPQAVVRTQDDGQTFALWYLQLVRGERPDVAIVDDRLLRFDWYRRQLLRRYPQLAGQGIADTPAAATGAAEGADRAIGEEGGAGVAATPLPVLAVPPP